MTALKTKLHPARVILSILLLTSAADGSSIRSIKVAGITDIFPIEYISSEKEPSGFYVDLWKLWSARTGIKVHYTIISPDAALKGLLNGTIDAVMGYSTHSSADKKVILTDTIFNRKIFIYHNSKITSPETFDDLKPYIVGALWMDSPALLPLESTISLIKKRTAAELYSESEEGKINIFLADSVSANYELFKKGKWKKYTQSSSPLLKTGIGAAVRTDRKELLTIINSGFSSISDSEKFFIEKTRYGGNLKNSIPWGYVAVITLIVTLAGGVILIWAWNTQLKKTVDKTTEELKRMKDEAEAASEAKSRFLDNISHELRTPLTLILAPVENALERGELDETILKMIRRNGRKLLSLINDLLDLSRTKSGKVILNLAETDLRRIIELYCAEIETSADIRGISVRCDVPDKPANVFIDREQFSRVMANLFSNSLKFTEPGGTINISIKDKDGETEIRFSDTGKGIPEEEINTVFERFVRADESSDNISGGTGIGLSLVREIIRLHGGSVAVESRHVSKHPVDHGTDFYVRLPQGKDHFQGRENINFTGTGSTGFILPFDSTMDFHQPVSSPAGDTAPLQNNGEEPSILVVEDNRDMRAFLEKILGRDYAVHSASDGVEALEILDKYPETDIVISDIMMPRMDGRQLLEEIRSDENLRHIPLLFLSARNDELMKHQGLELGAVDYVIKPFNPEELLLRIRNQIELRTIRNRLQRKTEELYSRLKNQFPATQKEQTLSGDMEERMEKVCAFIRENFREEINRDVITGIIGLNSSTLSRAFNRYTGKTLPDYTNEFRVEEAKRLLGETDMTVTRISINSGFDNLRTFNRAFKKFTGISPIEYREKNSGE